MSAELYWISEFDKLTTRSPILPAKLLCRMHLPRISLTKDAQATTHTNFLTPYRDSNPKQPVRNEMNIYIRYLYQEPWPIHDAWEMLRN
jgi:hypothetical protein